MHYFDSTTISESVYLHQVGNKGNGEPLVLSSNPLELTDTIKKDLKQYFLSHFKATEYSCFEHDASLSLNEVYSYVSAIFENQENLAQQSKYLAQCLYRKGVHPNIKGGEFYVVYFKNCLIDGEMTDAVGLFKSENIGLPEDISWMAFDEYYLRIKDKPEVDSRECSEENAKKWKERDSSVIKTEGNCRYCSDPDYYSPSWCTTKELADCYDRVFKVYKCERSDSIEWLALINYMKTLEEVYDVRAVFWFDD